MLSTNGSGNIRYCTCEEYCRVSIELLYRKALCYYYNEQPSKALALFNKCMDQQYREGSAAFYAGTILIMKDKKDEACLMLQRAILLGETDAIAYRKQYCK